MRLLLPFVLALITSATAPAATVLLVAADDAADQHAALLDSWRSQVRAEGWEVLTEIVPRTGWNSPDRATRALDILRLAETHQPRALFLFGAVARPATGVAAPDGHTARCVWNDFPYSGTLPSNAWTDATNHNVSTGLNFYRNDRGDGRWDQTYLVNGARWAVGRVDFSGLPELPRGSIPEGYYKSGSPRVPRIDEHAALADYLQRDLDWRQGRWQPDMEGIIFGSVYTPERGEMLARYRPKVTWKVTNEFRESPWAGHEVYAYASYGQDYRYSFYLSNIENGMIRGVWFSNLRSYEYEPIWEGGNQQGDQGDRRWLRHFLLVTWGYPDPVWMYGTSAADGYLALLSPRRYRTPHYQLDGDPTLPLDPAQTVKPSAPANLRLSVVDPNTPLAPGACE
ncbi:MAG: hypothetical protein JNK85_00620 [Verrucomicrobiales bacterium]|nr:hypothetical protein [Verrucomicrobiales bacterium]